MVNNFLHVNSILGRADRQIHCNCFDRNYNYDELELQLFIFIFTQKNIKMVLI